MPIYTESDGDKGIPRGIFIRLLIFLALICMSVFVMRPVQLALSMGMTIIRANIIEKIESFTGTEIRYSSIRPTIFGSFDIRNLELIKNENTVLSADHTRISFSMFELLRGKKTAVRTIQLDRPVFNLDTERDKEIIQLFSPNTADGEKNEDLKVFQRIAEFIPKRPDIRIRDCYLKISDGDLAYQIEKMDLDIGGDREKLSLNGNFTAEVRNTAFFNKSYGIKTRIIIDGVYSPKLEEGGAEVIFSSFAFSRQEKNIKGGNFFVQAASAVSGESSKALLNTQSLSVDLVFKNRLLSLNTSGENKFFKGYFDYNTLTDRMSAALECNDFHFSDIVSFTDKQANFNHLLTLPVRGKASFSREKNAGSLRYDVDFRGGEPEKSGDSFAIRVKGNEKTVSFDEFRFNASPGTAKAGLFQGMFSLKGSMGIDTLTPSGTVVFDRFSLTGAEYFNAVFNVSSNRKEIAITSKKAVSGKCVFDAIDVFLFPSQKDLGILVSVLREKEGRAGMEATLSYEPRQFDASLSLGSFGALDLVEIFRPFTEKPAFPAASLFLYNTSISAEVFFTTDFKHYVYNAPNIMIKSGDNEGVLSFSGTDRQFSLSEGIFNVDKKEFLLSANANFSNPQDFIFAVNASYLDFSWRIEGQLLDRSTLIIRDPNGLHAYGSVSNTGAVSGYLEGISYPVPVNGQPVYLNFYTTLRYNSRDFWSFDIARFEAVDFSSPEGNENLKISGSADQDGASFKELVFYDSTSSLEGKADFSWNRDFSFVQFNANMTDRRESGELYIIDGMLKDKNFIVNVSVSEGRINRFLKKSSPILLNADASISWDPVNLFNANIYLKSLYAKLNEDSIQASAAVTFTNYEFAVHDLNFSYAEISAFLPSLQINRAEGYVKASADVQGYVLEKWLDGKLQLDANFLNTNSWAEIRTAFSSINGSLKAENLIFSGVRHKPFDVIFANNDEGLKITGGPDNMLRMEMDREGDFFAGLSAPFPVQGSFAGNYKNGIIDARCNDFFLDLSSLWALLPSIRDFGFNGGYVAAKLDIKGPLANPEFFGTGRGTSLRMLVPNYLSEEVKPIPFNIAFDGSEMSFANVPFIAGKGAGSITGLFIFEKWIPDNFVLDIKVPKESPIPYKLNISGFLASGDVSGDVFLNLEDTTLDINGNLFANNTEMGMNFDEIMQIRPENSSASESSIEVAVNMQVTTGPVVEFAWPNIRKPIMRANPEMGTVLKVTADTLTGQYSINTDIKIRSGEINYFDRSFYIRQGNLVFRENEREFSPRLTARAEIRDRTDTGPVTISMIIDNEPLLNFVPRFEANPGLTQLEIYALLGQNMYFPGGGETIDAAQLFLTSTADILGQFIGLRTLERQVRNALKLDMFSVRTKILQNAVSTATAGAGLGISPVDRNNRVGNYFDNTTVSAGKYVGQDMFVQGMFSLSYDENSVNFGGFKPELDIGIELQSPFFKIRWDFFPYHPENWWVTDNSITLTWSKSF